VRIHDGHVQGHATSSPTTTSLQSRGLYLGDIFCSVHTSCLYYDYHHAPTSPLSSDSPHVDANMHATSHESQQPQLQFVHVPSLSKEHNSLPVHVANTTMQPQTSTTPLHGEPNGVRDTF
jgi:hypothetical protein